MYMLYYEFQKYPYESGVMWQNNNILLDIGLKLFYTEICILLKSKHLRKF